MADPRLYFTHHIECIISKCRQIKKGLGAEAKFRPNFPHFTLFKNTGSDRRRVCVNISRAAHFPTSISSCSWCATAARAGTFNTFPKYLRNIRGIKHQHPHLELRGPPPCPLLNFLAMPAGLAYWLS